MFTAMKISRAARRSFTLLCLVLSMISPAFGVTPEGITDLQGFCVTGSGNNEDFVSFVKAQYGDYTFTVVPDIPTVTSPDLNEGPTLIPVTISLTTAAGEVHRWYNGPLKIAVSDDDDTGAATLSPSTTTPNLTNGAYTVNLVLSDAVWTVGKKAWITASDPDTTGFGGWIASDVSGDVAVVSGDL